MLHTFGYVTLRLCSLATHLFVLSRFSILLFLHPHSRQVLFSLLVLLQILVDVLAFVGCCGTHRFLSILVSLVQYLHRICWHSIAGSIFLGADLFWFLSSALVFGFAFLSPAIYPYRFESLLLCPPLFCCCCLKKIPILGATSLSTRSLTANSILPKSFNCSSGVFLNKIVATPCKYSSNFLLSASVIIFLFAYYLSIMSYFCSRYLYSLHN